MAYFVSVFLATFVLEDVALATGLALVAQGRLAWSPAFLACFLGISIGDLGVYAMGAATARFGLEKRWHWLARLRSTDQDQRGPTLLTYSILLSRAIPGTRLPTYFSAGFVRYPLWKFTWLTLISVAAWVGVVFAGGRSLISVFAAHPVLSVMGFLYGLHLLKTYLPPLRDPWSRKALMSGWRKWRHFEFWPAWFFYLPIGPIYIYLWIKYRSPFLPFYASPHLAHGGLIGESKWEFLKHLNASDPHTLPAMIMPRAWRFAEAKAGMDAASLAYPLILKPDVGQRGFGVRIINHDQDLADYLKLADFDRIAQSLSRWPGEAGVFYIKPPREAQGFIFSLTDKKFPVVTGDGVTRLGHLILNDQRARVIAMVYFTRLKGRLDQIPANGETVVLAECGNNCQGAIFLDGHDLVTPALTREIARVAETIPDFYFGRFDVRYQTPEALMRGEHFQIVEVNGPGSEATHIWDARTTLGEAYVTLFKQWNLLFSVGQQVRAQSPRPPKVRLWKFIRECARVIGRKEPLSTSS